MRELHLRETDIKKVNLRKVPGGESFERVPFEMSYTEELIEITPALQKYIDDLYKEARHTFNDLNEEFREFCQDQGFNVFDFEGEDYDIFLNLLSVDDFKRTLRGTEDEYVKSLAAKYIFYVAVNELDVKLSKMYRAYRGDDPRAYHHKSYNEFYKTFDWLCDILSKTSLRNQDYLAFLNDFTIKAAEVAFDNDEEEIGSLLVNASVPSEPFWKH